LCLVSDVIKRLKGVANVISAKIRSALAREQCLWRQHKAEPNNIVLYNSYKHAEVRSSGLIAKHEIRRENKVIQTNNVGKFYRFVNRRLSNKKGIGAMQINDGTVVTSDRERAELLNKYFSSVCVRDDDNNPPLKRAALRDGNSINTVVLSAGNVMRAMRKLKHNLSRLAGQTVFHPLLIKQLSNCLAEPLRLIVMSFSQDSR